MGKKKPSKKPSVRRDPAVRERIIAVALEHPDLGTRRLSQLLKTEGIVASESGIRSILLKQGRHTRKLRQEILREKQLSKGILPTGEQKENIEEPIASLRRLEPDSSVPVSLQAEAEKAAKPEPGIPAGSPAHAPVDDTVKVPETRPERRSAWKGGKERWIFRAVSAALICVAIYVGAGTASKIWNILHLELDSTIAAAVPPAPDIRPAQVEAPAKPMETYRVIWERNLFKLSDTPKRADLPESIAIEKIAVAEKGVGLKLMGTVLANDPKLNYAVIDVAATRSQSVFREAEHVGGVLIKGISRNNVLIETENGEVKRLTVEDADLRNLGATQTLASAPPGSAAPPGIAQENEVGLVTVQIPREEISSSLSNIQLAMAASSLSPLPGDGISEGFYVASQGPQNILSRMGLLPGDLIMGMDGVHLQDPEDTEAIFQKFAEGGDFSMLVQRGDRIQNLHLVVK